MKVFDPFESKNENETTLLFLSTRQYFILFTLTGIIFDYPLPQTVASHE